MPQVQISKQPSKLETVKVDTLILDKQPAFPIIVQYIRPEGIEITILSPGQLNMRKIEIAMLQTARKLRQMRSEEVREQNKAEQVATDPADIVSFTEPKEEVEWPQTQTPSSSPTELTPNLEQPLKETEKTVVEGVKTSQSSSSN